MSAAKGRWAVLSKKLPSVIRQSDEASSGAAGDGGGADGGGAAGGASADGNEFKNPLASDEFDELEWSTPDEVWAHLGSGVLVILGMGVTWNLPSASTLKNLQDMNLQGVRTFVLDMEQHRRFVEEREQMVGGTALLFWAPSGQRVQFGRPIDRQQVVFDALQGTFNLTELEEVSIAVLEALGADQHDDEAEAVVVDLNF